MRLGIGHPGHKDRVAGYVLQDFAKADQEWLDDMMRGIADGAPWLAQGKADRFQNAVAQRMSPARPKPEPKPKSAPAPNAEPSQATTEDERSALQKLVDRFR